MKYYCEDLARVHDEGFSQIAEQGGEELLNLLTLAGLKNGTIVDLGCGGGRTAQLLNSAGYSVVGLDVSQELIDIAEDRVPEAVFHVGSFLDFEFSDLTAVCALGEVFNYTFDTRNSKATLRRFFSQVHEALKPKGVFLFDIAGTSRASETPVRTFTKGKNWYVLVESSRVQSELTREITTFIESEGLFRRDVEIHRLILIDQDEILDALYFSGFKVNTIDRYAEFELPAGLTGYCATKN